MIQAPKKESLDLVALQSSLSQFIPRISIRRPEVGDDYILRMWVHGLETEHEERLSAFQMRDPEAAVKATMSLIPAMIVKVYEPKEADSAD